MQQQQNLGNTEVKLKKNEDIFFFFFFYHTKKQKTKKKKIHGKQDTHIDGFDGLDLAGADNLGLGHPNLLL